MEWKTDCIDWRERIVEGRSLLPHAPLFPEEARASLEMFHELKLVDVYGMPKLKQMSRTWTDEFVSSIFGAYNAETGRRLIREFFMLISKKNSKAIHLDCPVATPDGFTTIRDLRVGDLVIGDDGLPAPVVAKSKVFTGRKCYEVEFSTGEKIVCDAEHLWMTDSHLDRNKDRRERGKYRNDPHPSVKDTATIAATISAGSDGRVVNNHRTALTKPLKLRIRNDLLLHPYVLGYWLGNGTSRKAEATCATEDAAHLVPHLVLECDQFVHAVRYDKTPTFVSLRFSEDGESSFKSTFRDRLEGENVFGNKHIPQKYLRGSYDQRLHLLQGLMDSDGTMSASGEASYTTKLTTLKDDAVELINSFGFKATLCLFDASYTLDSGEKRTSNLWRVSFRPNLDAKVFTLPRKVAKQRQYESNYVARSKSRRIVACREVPSVPTQCITVANESHQFLITRSLIPTHNSTSAAGIMLTALMRNWRHEAEFLVLAPTVEIANNCFSPARAMIKEDEELRAQLLVQPHIRTITHKLNGSTLKVIAADSEAVGGKKATGVLIDELWIFGKRAGADNMILEATGGLASRPEGFVIYLSTQSDEPPAGVFKEKLDYARDVRDGKIIDRTFLPLIYEFPEEILKNKGYLNPKNFYITNPNLGASVDVEFIENKFKQAANGEKTEDSYQGLLAKHLNVEIGLNLRNDRWPGADHWEVNADPTLTFDEFIKRCEVICGGGDGGGLDDLLALALAGRETGTGKWLAWTHAWAHPSVLKLRKLEAPRFHDFAQDRDLTLVEKIGDDITEFADIFSRVWASGKLHSIGLDERGLGGILDALEAAKIPKETPDRKVILGVPQGWRLNGAILTVERKLAEGNFIHPGQRMMNWCVGNAKVERHGSAVSITKQTSGNAKIDPLLAIFDAVTLLSTNPKAMVQEPSIRWL